MARQLEKTDEEMRRSALGFRKEFEQIRNSKHVQTEKVTPRRLIGHIVGH